MKAVVVRPGEGHRVGNVEFLARSADTLRFNLALITIQPHREGPDQHAHAAEDDSFYILDGELTFTVDDDEVIAYSRRVRAEHSPTGREDVVLVVVNLDPHSVRETMVHLDMPALGLGWPEGFEAHDMLSEQTFHWYEHVFVRLGYELPAHVVHVRRG